MKRNTAIIVWVALILSMISGCANTATPTSISDNGGKNTVDVIKEGFSAITFIEKEVSKEDIDLILQCGANAPSSRNMQPWHFTVVTDPEIVKSLARNAADETVVIVVSGKTEGSERDVVSFDCALATQNMYIAAHSLGLGARMYREPVLSVNETGKETLNIPEGFDIIMVLGVGYAEDDADAINSASPRNPLSSIVNYVE